MIFILQLITNFDIYTILMLKSYRNIIKYFTVVRLMPFKKNFIPNMNRIKCVGDFNARI